MPSINFFVRSSLGINEGNPFLSAGKNRIIFPIDNTVFLLINLWNTVPFLKFFTFSPINVLRLADFRSLKSN
jgi:hypothetical protein